MEKTCKTCQKPFKPAQTHYAECPDCFDQKQKTCATCERRFLPKEGWHQWCPRCVGRYKASRAGATPQVEPTAAVVAEATATAAPKPAPKPRCKEGEVLCRRCSKPFRPEKPYYRICPGCFTAKPKQNEPVETAPAVEAPRVEEAQPPVVAVVAPVEESGQVEATKPASVNDLKGLTGKKLQTAAKRLLKTDRAGHVIEAVISAVRFDLFQKTGSLPQANTEAEAFVAKCLAPKGKPNGKKVSSDKPARTQSERPSVIDPRAAAAKAKRIRRAEEQQRRRELSGYGQMANLAPAPKQQKESKQGKGRRAARAQIADQAA